MSEKAVNDHAAPWLGGLVPALLDFERLPGRYRLALREPGLLFEHQLAVMQLAAGRSVAGIFLPDEGPEADAAKKAARYFVRMAMLKAGSDHYTLLGLKADFEPHTLRDHYRLMIRLTHPDFSTPGEEWPADAASRINMANDVLGSYVKRSGYDAQLAAEKASLGAINPAFAAQASRVTVPTHKAPPHTLHPSQLPRRPGIAGGRSARAVWSSQSKMAAAICGAMACVFALLMLTPTGDDGSLVVQREQKRVQASEVAGGTTSADPVAEAPSRMAQAYAELNAGLPTVATTNSAAFETLPTPPANPADQNLLASPSPGNAVVTGRLARAKAREAPAREAKEEKLAWPDVAPKAVEQAATTQELAQIGETQSPKIPTAPAPAPSALVPEPPAPPTPTSAHSSVASSPVPVAAPARTPDQPVLALVDVQPLLSKVVAAMDSGIGENALDVVHSTWNVRKNRVDFLRGYYKFLQNERIDGVNSVSFRPQAKDGSLVVNGVLNVKMRDSFDATSSKDMRIKATFVRHIGKPALTQLEVVGLPQ